MIFKFQTKLAIVVAAGIIISHQFFGKLNFVAAQNRTTFEDIQGHWAQSCIEDLAKREIVKGYYENDTFRPNLPVSRAEFAALVSQAFPNVKAKENPTNFVDVPTDFWAYAAIREANRKGFMTGFIGSAFNPLLNISRVQALVALANGLDYEASQLSPQQLRQIFTDASEIPEYAEEAIATATEHWLVVNYPNVRQLNPNKPATRAEVATFICQAISEDPQQALVPTQYIARVSIDDLPQPTPEPEQSVSKQSPEPEQSESRQSPEPEPTPEPKNSPEPRPKPSPSTPPVSAQPQNTPPIESRPESTPNIEDLTVQRTATSDDIEAELLANSDNTIQLMQIKIERNGELISENVISMASLLNPGVKTVKTGRVLDFKILDLDNDKEPEVLVDVLLNADNNVKTYASVIYRYSPIKKEYRSLQQKWGVIPYQLQTESVEAPIFITYDQRFSQEFQSYTSEQLPLQIFQYRSGEWQNITQQYSERLEEHNQALLQEISKRRRLKQDLKGVLAAYLAQQYLLDQADAGWKIVEENYQNADKNQFFTELRQWLKKTGYTD